MTKTEILDRVAVKRRAQRSLAKALEGKSPEEQTETLQRLAARAPNRTKADTSPPCRPSHFMERETGFEPATLSLGRGRSRKK